MQFVGHFRFGDYSHLHRLCQHAPVDRHLKIPDRRHIGWESKSQYVCLEILLEFESAQ